MKHTLAEVKLHVEALAEKIDAPREYLPTFGYSEDAARPHIEINNGHLCYVIVERGEELKRDLPVDLEHLLYLVFSDITSSMAGKFEVANRIEGEDFRRQLFAKQEELLGILNPEWELKKQDEHNWILKSHPFSH